MWAVPADTVRSISSTGDGSRVLVGEIALIADEVVKVERELDVKPAGPIFQWAAPAGTTGLAVCEHGPLVVIDPARPPAVLLFEK